MARLIAMTRPIVPLIAQVVISLVRKVCTKEPRLVYQVSPTTSSSRRDLLKAGDVGEIIER